MFDFVVSPIATDSSVSECQDERFASQSLQKLQGIAKRGMARPKNRRQISECTESAYECR